VEEETEEKFKVENSKGKLPKAGTTDKFLGRHN